MGIFDNKRRSISRRELKQFFRKDSGFIPRTGGKKYYRKDRDRLMKEVFGLKYGSQIDKKEYRRAVRELESSKRNAKDRAERLNIEQKINYLKDQGGRDIR